MRPILLRTILGVALLLVPVAAVAGISLSPIMESWNHSKRQIEAMLAGQAPYDEAQIRQDLERYIGSSATIAREMKGNTPEARDLAARFEAFANDGRSALGGVGQPSAVNESFQRMVGDCQSCHAIYNN